MLSGDAIKQCERLLEKEREALAQCNWHDLERLAVAKEKLLARLREHPADTARLRDLHLKALRNERLLAAATRGIQRAKTRISAQRQSDAQIVTYGPEGKTHRIAGPTLTMKQKV